jgi:hypothetical protein
MVVSTLPFEVHPSPALPFKHISLKTCTIKHSPFINKVTHENKVKHLSCTVIKSKNKSQILLQIYQLFISSCSLGQWPTNSADYTP